MGFGVLHHALDLVVVQRGGAGDGDLLLLAGAQVLRRHVHDAVGVDVESDLDLRHTTARSRDAGELELAQRLVVGGHLALALQHVDLHAGLERGGGAEHLRVVHRQRGVALHEARRHAAHRLDGQAERRHV